MNFDPDNRLAERARRKFVKFFPAGFRDETYLDWERNYKWQAHEAWEATLGASAFQKLIQAQSFEDIAAAAVKIESRTNLLFSFEKMALRDAIKMPGGARTFSTELYAFLHQSRNQMSSFTRWCDAVATLPRKQTRVLTWPIVTVFGFIAQPDRHIFLKPNVTKIAARRYGFDFSYQSRPSSETYASLLAFAETVRRDQKVLKPQDMIDLQSFIWVQGSDEYS